MVKYVKASKSYENSELVKFKNQLLDESGWDDSVNPDWEDDLEAAFYRDSGGMGFSKNVIEAVGCENKADVIRLIDMLLNRLNIK